MKKLFFLFFTISTFIFSFGQTTDKQVVKDLMRAADSEKDVYEAIALYTKVIELEPNSAAAGEHIVMMNLKSGGNAENWGDLAQGRSGCTAFSDCHGGLGGF